MARATDMNKAPLFYVREDRVYQRPVRRHGGGTSMGFLVCNVADGVDPGEAPPENEPAPNQTSHNVGVPNCVRYEDHGR